jgi:hypothetical protein
MTLKIILLTFLSVTLFSCESEKRACKATDTDHIFIGVENQSGQSILSVFIEERNMGIKSTRYPGLADGEQTCIAYKGSGETEYRFKVVLANGDTIGSSGEYAEGGYLIYEKVLKDRIVDAVANDYY